MAIKSIQPKDMTMTKAMAECLSAICVAGGSATYQKDGMTLCAGELLKFTSQTLLNLICEGYLASAGRRLLWTTKGYNWAVSAGCRRSYVISTPPLPPST